MSKDWCDYVRANEAFDYNPEPKPEGSTAMSDDVQTPYRDRIAGALLEAGQEIKRLHAEVEEKDRRIEELSNETHILNVVCPGHHITDEQIDAAWIVAHDHRQDGTEQRHALAVLAEMGIVECDTCEHRPTEYRPQDCPRCHGHRWIREEQADE